MASTAALDTELVRLREASVSDATRRVYRQRWDHFRRFQATYPRWNGTAAPTTDTVLAYIAHLSRKRYALPSARTSLSAISWWCKANGWADPCVGPDIHTVMRGFARLHGGGDVRAPFTLFTLDQLLNHLSASTLSGYDKLLFRTMGSLAFFGLLRLSELVGCHALRVQDVVRVPSATGVSLRVTVRSSKASQRSQVVSIQPRAGFGHCPCSLLVEYLRCRPEVLDRNLFLFRTGRRISASFFSRELKKWCAAAGLGDLVLSSHSFRIGGATLLYEQGYSDLAIQRAGRWSSDSYQRYVRPALGPA